MSDDRGRAPESLRGDELERALRKALHTEDPGEEFAAKVLASLDRPESTPTLPVRNRDSGQRTRIWLPVALAASLAGVLVIRHELLQHRAQEGMLARQQLIEALKVTSQKLDIAYRAVNAPATATDDESGA